MLQWSCCCCCCCGPPRCFMNVTQSINGEEYPCSAKPSSYKSTGQRGRTHYLHCKSLVSMSSSNDRKSTTRMTQATRIQLKPALRRQTCHRATRRPQHGFSQLDLTGEETTNTMKRYSIKYTGVFRNFTYNTLK